jgi:hypothetical protein
MAIIVNLTICKMLIRVYSDGDYDSNDKNYDNDCGHIDLEGPLG